MLNLWELNPETPFLNEKANTFFTRFYPIFRN